MVATQADLLEAELAMVQWQLQKARQRGAQPPAALLEQREELKAALRRAK